MICKAFIINFTIVYPLTITIVTLSLSPLTHQLVS